jgi:elongation factor Ts
MAEITAALVRQLREETGLPMMDCKQALTESGGDITAAKEKMSENGLKLK